MNKLTIEDLKTLVVKARDVLPDAVISGGAPRDILHGVPVKDIDLMTGYGVTKTVLERLAEAVGGTFVVEEPLDPSGMEEFEWEIDMGLGRPAINVICLDPFEITDPVDNLHDFDFGLSQIAVTSHGAVMTPAAALDIACNRITYMGDRGREDWRIASSAKRLKRLEAKYPNRIFLNCDALRQHPEYK
ncbi:hypothetical protein QCE62_00165 [Caballeronia sp. LZ033]|uniref:hypothetical protein n=1 Tax=Caballeronia sp. LZ033 TaxID=3038566 RepID=UPI00285B4452|nr:hypothetical protein [Caballeronia sp. LZ033]MDR5812001.1 hypothetical protein [Caballeronia sp. LZ033]